MNEQPRLTTLMGVARAVLATAGAETGARALVAEYGWDATLHALALLRGEDAREAFGHTWSALVLDGLEDEVAPADTPPADDTAPIGPARLDDGTRDG